MEPLRDNDGEATRDDAAAVPGMRGARVAVLEARHGGVLARLVERYGGVPYAVPALSEAPIDSGRVDHLVRGIARGRFSVVIFQTGVAAQRLFDEADRRGQLEMVQDRLRRCTTACRGPKPSAVLARYGIMPTVRAAEPSTTRELLEALTTVPLDRKSVALLHYGEANRELAIALRTRGARLAEYLLYEWRLPEDTEPLRRLVREIVAGGIDAIAFTNQIQIRHLCRIGEEIGCADELAQALMRRVVVASIGPTCSHQLRLLGIPPRVVPASPKMRPLIAALAEHLSTFAA